MEDNYRQEESASHNSNTLDVFQQFQKLYMEQLKETDETYDGLKLKVKILENLVQDLTNQNEMLVKTVDELEGEALKRLSMIEASITQRTQTSSCLSPREVFSPKGLDQVESLSKELEEVKQQLLEKENLVSKYQSRIEELRNLFKRDKFDNSNKMFVHRYSMTDETTPTDTEHHALQLQPSVYKELETTQIQLCQMEKEVAKLKKKLKEADISIKRLRSDLVASEKNAWEMRSALTAEVAEKHDQILALRREVTQLEDQLRQADMQTHFKDDIIKELRKEVKVARSKETLVEVLGIKERSLSHLEHLTEQLEQKEHTITCLKSKLQQYKDNTPDTFYRVKQQVDWFTENMLQQCAKGNVPEEFKKCITTMLEELRESIDCCNFGPTNTAEPCKEFVDFMTVLQNSLDQSQKSLSQSWTSIWDTSHQINKLELTDYIEQWKKCLAKQQYLQQKLQQLIQSLTHAISSTKVHTGTIANSLDSLYYMLGNFKEALDTQSQGKSVSGWLKKLQSLISESILKIEEISDMAAAIRDNEKKLTNELESKMGLLNSFESELNDVFIAEQKAYGKLCRIEKAQRTKVDTLLATVLHHNEVWNQQVALSDDMKREILGLAESFKKRIIMNTRQGNTKVRNPLEQHSLYLKSLVTKISTDIQSSISDIGHRQSQVSHLEIDLSSVRLVLESAQEEIDNITNEHNARDITQKIMHLLNKLKKETRNALIKVNGLIETYTTTKQDYIISSERILEIQREFDSLEEELYNYRHYISQDFNKPPKTPGYDKMPCPMQTELDIYKKKIVEKDIVIKHVKEDVTNLKSNLKERDKLTATQDETIQVLQNSLKICQAEVEELQTVVESLEFEKTEIEKDYKKQIEGLQNKITDLHNSLKKSEDVARKHKTSEAALQIVIANLRESLSKEQKKYCALRKENEQLQEQMKNTSTAYKMELESNNKREAALNQDNQTKIIELKKQAKSWAAKVTEIEEQMKNIQDELCDSALREKELQEELASQQRNHKEKIYEHQKEMNKLSEIVKSLTEKLKVATADLDNERVKFCETEQKLQTACVAYEDLKIKAKEKETTAEKLHIALTQLSNKFVSRGLDNKGCLKHYQEECAKFEALYNTTACKLRSKEVEMSAMIQEIERLKDELNQINTKPSQEREDESCPFLLERIQQLSKEIQVAHSCQNSYETLIKDLTEKCSKKEEEVSQLKSQLKQLSLQRDTLVTDLERTQDEIDKLKVANSNLYLTVQKVELNKAQITEQMKSMQRMVCDSQNANTQSPCLQPNIELQREISTVLSSQLRSVKQKLHSTKHDYKLLQAAYEELNQKYSLLQRGERDLGQIWDSKTQHTPWMSKSSKSMAYVRHSEETKDRAQGLRYSSNSKSWHKLDTSSDLEQRERKWKQKLQKVIRGEDFDEAEIMNNSSSSN